MEKIVEVTIGGKIFIGYKHISYILHTEEKGLITDIQHFDTEKEMREYIFKGE